LANKKTAIAVFVFLQVLFGVQGRTLFKNNYYEELEQAKESEKEYIDFDNVER